MRNHRYVVIECIGDSYSSDDCIHTNVELYKEFEQFSENDVMAAEMLRNHKVFEDSLKQLLVLQAQTAAHVSELKGYVLFLIMCKY